MEAVHANKSPETTLELLASQHQARGSAPAILAPGREPVSFAALRAEIDRVGVALAGFGLGRRSRIAVSLPDGPDAGLAMLAAMSWATCSPLDPRLDAAPAWSTLFAQLRIDALLTTEDASAAVQAARASGLTIVRVSAPASDTPELLALRAESARSPVASTAPRPDDVALVVLTSGTTSTPKVVPLTHRALVCAAGPRPIGPADRCLSISPLHTTSGLGFGLIMPLAKGASTVLTPGFDAALFFDWLETFKPTFFSASPTVHMAIIDEILRRRPTLPGSLRFVRSSSNGMSAPLQERLESLLRVPVIQGYGSTEAGLITQDAPPPGERRIGSVGRTQGAEIRIADPDGEPLPARSAGEILVRGLGVMSGYENDAEANRLAFRDGWFRTGDLGYFDADGYLFLSGRIKELINRGGLKVAPAEVDAVFMRHPDVSDVATVGMPHPTLGEDVVTAIIARQGASITADQLRQYALGHMSPAKAPTSVVFVDDFPRSALGKVQRGALAEVLKTRLRPEFVAPRDAEEELVATIFTSLLGLPRVGALDNFFDLGGDSLRAVQLVSRICAETGLQMEPIASLEASTVEQLARRLRTLRRDPAARAAGHSSLVRRARRPDAAMAAEEPSPRSKTRSSH